MKSLKTLIYTAICLFFVACSTKQPNTATGADRDKNNCITSAGYQWSNLKKECIRPFELPIQLENIDKTFSAGVIISDDLKEAEIFTKDGSFIAVKQSEKNYVNDKFDGGRFLKKIDNKWVLGKIKGDVIEYTESM